MRGADPAVTFKAPTVYQVLVLTGPLRDSVQYERGGPFHQWIPQQRLMENHMLCFSHPGILRWKVQVPLFRK